MLRCVASQLKASSNECVAVCCSAFFFSSRVTAEEREVAGDSSLRKFLLLSEADKIEERGNT